MISLKDDINNALKVLNAGGIILYPTDTIWGIGCDATNEEAVKKVNELKGRSVGKHLIVLLDTENKLASYVREIPDVAYELMDVTDRPLTIVYSGAKNLADSLISGDGTIGIRVVKHDFCKQLIARFRKPIVSTSANYSGQPSPASFADIDAELISSVDYVVQHGQEEYSEGKSSTIIKLGPSGQFELIRK